MRFLLTPFAIAAGLLLGLLHVPAVAEKEPPKGDVAPRTEDDSPTWPELLKKLKPAKEERLLLEQLAPFLAPATYLSLTPAQRDRLLLYARARLDGTTLLTRCWSPETPAGVVLAYHAVDEAAHEAEGGPALEEDGESAPRKANQFFRRWGATATDGGGVNVQGRPVTLTWSIVPDGTDVPSDPTIGDSDDPSDLIAWLNGLYGSVPGPPASQPWFPLLEGVFADIGAKTGINYVYEPNDDGETLSLSAPGVVGVRGDLRLAGHDIDGIGSTLAYNYFPDRGDMVIDTADDWFDNISNNSVRLANTMAHEHGHGLGLEHVCPLDSTKLLEPFIRTNFRGIQFDEIYTLQRQYGDFYEQHGAARDNDSFATAAAIPVTGGTPFGFEWLSIDDNGDTDYYAFPAQADAGVTVRVLPSTLAYLEGAQLATGGCSSGAAFDPGAHHDLALTLYAPDQTTVLASADLNPAGQLEEIVNFPISAGGTHYLRVTGGSANLAQLYRLEVEITSPAISIALQSSVLTTESFAPSDGVIDPGETVELDVLLGNGGTLEATNVQATLSGPSGFTGFTTAQDYGTVPSTGSASRKFVFGLQGACGDVIDLTLTVTATEEGFTTTIPLPVVLGTVVTLLDEPFDAAGNLPAGWSSSKTASGTGWSVSTVRAASAPHALFAGDVGSTGTSTLTSPAITAGPAGATLTFRHFFNTEAEGAQGFDGGVLELSVEGGPWQDVLAAGAVFVEGGYTATLSTAFQNPLPGRQAWAGDSGDFLTTVVDLPAAFANQSLRFRWRLGHDSSVGDEGWYLDDVAVTTKLCGSLTPTVSLTLDDASASEFTPLDFAQFTLSTALPSLANLPIALLNSGNAVAGVDATGLDNIVLPAGQSTVQVLVQGVQDNAVEGDEELVLAIDPASGVAPAGAPEVTITIADSPYGLWAATTLGLAGANGPLDDFEGDGSLNIEEYTWQTDATSPSSRPGLHPRLEDGAFRLDAPLAALPADVLLSAESSLDLQSWSPAGVETLADGFKVTADAPERYLRLVYQLLPAAP